MKEKGSIAFVSRCSLLSRRTPRRCVCVWKGEESRRRSSTVTGTEKRENCKFEKSDSTAQ